MTGRTLDDDELLELTLALHNFARAACEQLGADVPSLLRLLLVAWISSEQASRIRAVGRGQAEAEMTQLLSLTVGEALQATNEAAREMGAAPMPAAAGGVGHA